MTILIEQDGGTSEDHHGRRGKARPEDLRSGALFGQYQLRGSILVLKDSLNDASGFIAFGTDITTIPTSSAPLPANATGILIDYTGITGWNAGVLQASFSSADGTITAGSGTDIIDANGIRILLGTSYSAPDATSLIFRNGANTRDAYWLGGHDNAGTVLGVMYAEAATNKDSTISINSLDGGAGQFSKIEILADHNTASVISGITFFADATHNYAAVQGDIRPQSDSGFSLGTPSFRWLNVNMDGVIRNSGNQVVGARNTGWTAMTGTADESTAYASGTITLVQLAERVNAIQVALTTHGLIGT